MVYEDANRTLGVCARFRKKKPQVRMDDPNETSAAVEPDNAVIIWLLGLAYLALPAFTLVLFVAFAALGAINTAAPYIVSELIVIASLYLALQKVSKSRIKCTVLTAMFAVSIAAITALSTAVLDSSWDGQTYHQETVICISQGWNPIMTLKDPLYQVIPPWYNAKGFEYIASAMYSATHHLESGKATNFFLMLASLFLAYTLFVNLSNDRKRAALYAVLIAVNPITTTQLCTFYVDGVVGSTYTCLLSSISLLFLKKSNLLTYAGILFSTIILINLKLSSVLLVAITYACALIVSTSVFNAKVCRVKFARNLTLLLIVSAGVGINPFAANLYRLCRSPAETLKLSAQSVKFIENFAPPGFFEAYPNYFMRLATSLLCETNDSNAIATEPKYKLATVQQIIAEHPNLEIRSFENTPIRIAVPFSLSPGELKKFKHCDIQLGGFGPWFGEAVFIVSLISLCVLFKTAWKKRETLPNDPVLYKEKAERSTNRADSNSVLFFCISATTISTLAIEHSWWARFVPQLWTIPVVAMIWWQTTGPAGHLKRITNVTAVLVCLLLLGDASIVAVANFLSNFETTNIYNKEIRAAQIDCQKNNGACLLIYSPETVSLHPAVQIRLDESQLHTQITHNPPGQSDTCYRVTDLPIFVFLKKQSGNNPNL